MDMEIEIKLKEKIDLKKGVLINAFPGPGFSAMIAANYIIDKMGLEPVGTIKSPYFPATAVIHDYVPYHPMRFYGKDGLLILITEFNLKPEMAKFIAEKLIEVYDTNKMRQIINLEAIADTRNKDPEDYEFYGVATLEAERKRLEKEKITLFKEGMISGTAGELLSEGQASDLNIVTLLTEVNPMYPDVQGAISFVENLNTLLDELDIDLEDLKKEAVEIEGAIKDSIHKAQELMSAHQSEKALQVPQSPPTPYMYG